MKTKRHTNRATQIIRDWTHDEYALHYDLLDVVRAAKDTREASQAMQSYFEDHSYVSEAPGVFGDLMSYAMSNIDWAAIVSDFPE